MATVRHGIALESDTRGFEGYPPEDRLRLRHFSLIFLNWRRL